MVDVAFPRLPKSLAALILGLPLLAACQTGESTPADNADPSIMPPPQAAPAAPVEEEQLDQNSDRGSAGSLAAVDAVAAGRIGGGEVQGSGAEGYGASLSALRSTAPGPSANTSAGDGVITVVGVGDIMIGTNFPDPSYLPVGLAPGVDPSSVLDAELLSLIQGADLAIGNLEGSLYDGDGPHKQCGNPANCYVFRSPEYYGGILADIGFDLFGLANNHSGDFLDAGRAATRGALDRVGIGYAGLDQPGARTTSVMLDDGTQVGFIAFAPNPGTLPITDIPRAERLVADLAASNDVVIVTFHGGGEGTSHTRVTRQTEIFLGENRGDVFAFSRRMVDAGADLVLGHGPHVPRAVEVYDGRLIAYSLGNFWTYGRFNLRGPNGLAPIVEVALAPDGSLLSARVHSAVQVDRGIPRYDPTHQAAAMVAELTALDFPEAAIRFSADGTLSGTGLASLP